jgi:hypothetical protein
MYWVKDFKNLWLYEYKKIIDFTKGTPGERDDGKR